MSAPSGLRGRCACGRIQYELLKKPLFTHCCHCTRCQTETGSAFAINILIEAGALKSSGPDAVQVDTPTLSGGAHRIARCPTCQIALWSTYSKPEILFVKGGTLDEPGLCEPDIHIFASRKQAWVVPPAGLRTEAEFYEYSDAWPAESYRRYLKACQ